MNENQILLFFVIECKEDLEENTVISTRNKREIENKHRKQTIKEDTLSNGSDKVCIEYNGNIRRDGEVWTHSNIEADLKTCAECICKVVIISKISFLWFSL